MKLVHPITNISTEAIIQQNKQKEYVSITFDDGIRITDENYMYDILFEAKVITAEQYNKQFWESTIEHVNN